MLYFSQVFICTVYGIRITFLCDLNLWSLAEQRRAPCTVVPRCNPNPPQNKAYFVQNGQIMGYFCRRVIRF